MNSIHEVISYAATPEGDGGFRDIYCESFFRLKGVPEEQIRAEKNIKLARFEELLQAVPAYAVDIAMRQLHK